MLCKQHICMMCTVSPLKPESQPYMKQSVAERGWEGSEASESLGTLLFRRQGTTAEGSQKFILCRISSMQWAALTGAQESLSRSVQPANNGCDIVACLSRLNGGPALPGALHQSCSCLLAGWAAPSDVKPLLHRRGSSGQCRFTCRSC